VPESDFEGSDQKRWRSQHGRAGRSREANVLVHPLASISDDRRFPEPEFYIYMVRPCVLFLFVNHETSRIKA
jgi:hypothetical protein